MVSMRFVAWLVLSVWIAESSFLLQQSKSTPNAQPDPAAILSEAQALYRKGSFDPAIARFNDALKADPASGDAYAGIIRCYLKQDKVEEADDVLHKALQTVPAHPDVKVAEAELLFRQGEIPEAGKLFEEVIAFPPDPAQPNAKPNARAYLGAARVAAANAMYAREHVLIQRAHALDAFDADIRKLWMNTLSIADRIQSLADYLAQPTNDDEDARRRLHERLDFLKASQSAQSARCRPASDFTGTRTTLTSISLGNGGFLGSGMNVQISGEPARLLLDTGASGILISRNLATQAGLTPASEVRMRGIGDEPDVPAHISFADSVRIGEMEFRNCPLYILDRVPKDTDGVLGADVFSQYLIELDFPTSTLTLSQLPPRPGEKPSTAALNTGTDETAASEAKSSANSATPADSRPAARYQDRYVAPEMHSYAQVFRFGHMLLVPTTINENSSKLFLVDTGAFDNTITPAAARELTKVHRAPRIDVRGLNGEVKKVYVADRVTLDFGHLRQTVPTMVAIDMSHASRQAGTEISGTIGMALLTLLKVRLDYRDALADFQYTPKPPRR